MRKKKIDFPKVAAITAIFLILTFLVSLLIPVPHVKVGEIWQYTVDPTYHHENSPFKDCQQSYSTESQVYTYRVLEVKKGWVKWVDEHGDERCSPERWFLIGSKKIASP